MARGAGKSVGAGEFGFVEEFFTEAHPFGEEWVVGGKGGEGDVPGKSDGKGGGVCGEVDGFGWVGAPWAANVLPWRGRYILRPNPNEDCLGWD